MALMGADLVRFRCCFLPLRSLWVLFPGPNTQMVFLDHIWERASPVLHHRMPRTLAAVHFTWHCSHPSLAESVVGASGGRSSPFWLAGSSQGLLKAKFLSSSLPEKQINYNTVLPTAALQMHTTSVTLHLRGAPLSQRCLQPSCQVALAPFVLTSHGPGALHLQLPKLLCIQKMAGGKW